MSVKCACVCKGLVRVVVGQLLVCSMQYSSLPLCAAISMSALQWLQASCLHLLAKTLAMHNGKLGMHGAKAH